MRQILLALCLSLSSVICAAQNTDSPPPPHVQALTAINEQLLSCVEEGDADCVARALVAGADANATDKNSIAVLTLAAEGKSARIVRLLLDAGADVDEAARGGGSPLCRAALFGRRENAAALLEREAKVNVVCDSDHGETPLMQALLGAWLSSLPMDLKEELVGKDDTTDGGENEDAGAAGEASDKAEKLSEVRRAPRADFLAIAHLLLERGADVNATTDCELGETALMYAAIDANTEMVKELLERGADVKMATPVLAMMREVEREYEKAGRVALPALSKEQSAMLAWSETTRAAREEIAQLLKAAGAKENDDEDEEPEHDEAVEESLEDAADEAFTSTVKKNDVEDLKRLIEAYLAHPLGTRALPEALRTAVIYNRKEMVKLLLARGVDPNGGRYKPLTHAVHNSDLEFVQMLLEAGADVNATDDEGRTVLDYTENWTDLSEERRAIIEALKARGARSKKQQ
jgi:ankyrin repeat protein